MLCTSAGCGRISVPGVQAQNYLIRIKAMEELYRFLEGLGYQHPIHPTQVNMPIGLVMGALIFGLAALMTRKAAVSTVARSVIVLAFVFFFPAVLTGFLDWRHFYGGAWIYPIRIKMGLAVVLFVLLLLAVIVGRRREGMSGGLLAIFVLACADVMALGYFGGEIVFGGRAPQAAAGQQAGEMIYRGNCGGCHPYGGNAVKPSHSVICSPMLADSGLFVKWLRKPEAPMPVFSPQDITDGQVLRLYDYIIHSWGERSRENDGQARGGLPGLDDDHEHEAGGDELLATAVGQQGAVAVAMTAGLTFQPARVSIKVGKKVKWSNSSPYIHTVTADPDKAFQPEHVTLPPGAEPFDSGSIQPGGVYLHTFEVPGKYRYFCIPHEAAGMIGEVEVRPAN